MWRCAILCKIDIGDLTDKETTEPRPEVVAEENENTWGKMFQRIGNAKDSNKNMLGVLKE